MSDPTENIRRKMVEEINQEVISNQPDVERKKLESIYGSVWNTEELQRDFEVEGFMAPFVAVTRKSDRTKGTIKFQHHPRFYFQFLKS